MATKRAARREFRMSTWLNLNDEPYTFSAYRAEMLSKAESLALSKAMRQRLPREIRDMIYACCLATSSEFDRPLHNFMKMRLQDPDAPPFSGGFSLPHFLIPEFVGSEAVQEAVEVHYRTKAMVFDKAMSFNISKGSAPPLSDALALDYFWTGHIPANLIRSLRFELLSQPESRRTNVRYDCFTRWLLSLLQLPQSILERISVEFRTWGKTPCIVYTLGVMADMFAQLRGVGVKVMVMVYGYNAQQKFGLTYTLDLPEKEQAAEWRKNIAHRM
ncbi:hypothetical protein P154DRAFT_299516 [Amniculicola lignicola CBS 123094]|uniref:Uncharacterized protein n=1 Tax=Amniculicola lignicola CBS 123094 TaxID=1392246 RepID=A0A6A5W8Q7_9PLEO|nr:hypothetical protein P154DRAFT_299516 [Amniculicola lignicola CBS 123094]